jgi:NAD/NADP transhydrogenase beta subunit
MGRVGRYFEHLFLSVAKGCLLTALVAGILAMGAVLLIDRALPTTADFMLILVIVILAGAFGGAIALIWRMTHIPELVHAAEHLSDHARQESK